MHIPGHSQLKDLYKKLTPIELGVFAVASLLMVVGVFGLLRELQQSVSVSVPTRGGSLEEGIVGFPRYINPVIASTNADQDISALVYSGLTKLDNNGEIELDLAADLEVSADGTSYTFTIRKDARFHDGHPVQAEDIVYTINMLQDQRIDSPLVADWSGISAQATDDQTVVFDLSDPFRDFLFNTRIGILPKHLWINETANTFPFASLNTNPVGAGPYKVADIERNDEGLPTRYHLTTFTDHHSLPFITNIYLEFFADADSRNKAFASGKITSMYGISAGEASKIPSERIVTKPLTRIFAIFLNQSRNEALVESQVREALSLAIDKQVLVSEILGGYGVPLTGPLPTDVAEEDMGDDEENHPAKAQELLAAAGWSNEDGQLTNSDGEVLSIELTTADIPELQETADQVADSWRELGITVTVSVLSTADLSQEVIRPRNYEALLFGQIINQQRDLYPFWHSGEQDDPGLNLAMYANSSVDSLLEQYRSAESSSEQSRLSQEVATAITADQPAIFLYTPHFIYAVPKNTAHITLPPITVPADRFAQIENWYTKTINVWKIFVDEEETKAQEEMSTTSATSSADG
ncbi:MAG: ABC transporter substrate-binding protein [Candidatus Paceibacterota bacterium]